MDNLCDISLEDGGDILANPENNPVEVGISGVAGADVQFGHRISASAEVKIRTKVVTSPTQNGLTVGVVAEGHCRNG